MNCVTWVGRLLSRVFVTGFHGTLLEQSAGNPLFRRNPFPSLNLIKNLIGTQQVTPEYEKVIKQFHTRGIEGGPAFISVVSGLPKKFTPEEFRPGKFGDDAWFVAKNRMAEAMGVADGVGGWRDYGLDPGEFSFSLMKACENLVERDRLSPSKPESLLARAFNSVRSKKDVLGSSTACLLILNRADSTLYSANLGDSGFLILRNGQILYRSKEQVHCFNTPFQLSCAPPGESFLCDSPEAAVTSHFNVLDGDMILLATDGVFDNVPDHILMDELKKAEGSKDSALLQTVANAIALMARTLAFDSKHMSPFAKSALKHGIKTIGGKPDDITVLLATVCMSQT